MSGVISKTAKQCTNWIKEHMPQLPAIDKENALKALKFMKNHWKALAVGGAVVGAGIAYYNRDKILANEKVAVAAFLLFGIAVLYQQGKLKGNTQVLGAIFHALGKAKNAL